MAVPILATKLFIPPIPNKVVTRPRLIAQLTEGLSMGRKLTLVSAPAGFGKSTLVSEWIAGCGRPAAWYSLDEGDHDPSRFLIYLIGALQTISPGLGDGITEALQSPQSPAIQAILTAALNEIAAIQGNFILVLDDYHLVDSKAIDEALTFLVDHLPAQMHLVITTREDPGLPIPRLRARNQLTEIRAMDLRFAPSEASEFLNQVMNLDLTADEVVALEARTEGWIAGLQLAALSMRGQEDISGFIQAFAGDHRYIVDYLVEEVLRRQPESIRFFLLQTSILERLNGSLCDAVTAQEGSKSRLEQLQRGNLFLIPLDDKRHWYRYHHLFADMLRMHLTVEQPDMLRALNERASRWYEQNGSLADAVCHAYGAEDFSRVAWLAETAWQKMHDSFQSATWLGWVKELPDEVIRVRPVLCTQIAWGYMDAHKVDASESWLRDAEQCLTGSSDSMIIVEQEQFRSLRARIAFARAYNAQTRRDFRSAIKYAKHVLELLPDENQPLRAQTTAILGATYLINGDLDGACQSMDDWIEKSLKSGNFFSAFAYAMAEKADILTAQGHLRAALSTYQQSLQLATEHDSRVLRVMVHPYLGMAMLYFEMGDYEKADQHFQKSLDVAGLHMSVDWSYRRCVAQARLKESAGDLDAAINLLEEAKCFYIKTLIPHTRPIEALKARIYIKQGLFSKVEEWVSEQKIAVDDELVYLREFEHITLARLLLAQFKINRSKGRLVELTGFLTRLLGAAEEGRRLGSQVEILVLHALTLQAEGDLPAALMPLERALILAEPEGYVRVFVDEGQAVRLLIEDLRRLHLQQVQVSRFENRFHGLSDRLIPYLDRLLAVFAGPSVAPYSLSLQVEKQQPMMVHLVEPLSQRELDILRLFKTELSGPEIAQELVIALSTVRTHTKNIYSKLGVNNRRAAIIRATELNLI